MKPDEIEKLSFQIIEREIGANNFENEQWLIVRRMIHTSADFEYKDMVRFHPDAVQSGLDAIRSGKTIITDTNMARVGIRKKELDQFGASTVCFMNDPAVHRRAKASRHTRARVAVDMAVGDMQGGIYVVGNAPTALMRLVELVIEQKAQPALDYRIAGRICERRRIQSSAHGTGLSLYIKYRPQGRLQCGGQRRQCAGDHGRRGCLTLDTLMICIGEQVRESSRIEHRIASIVKPGEQRKAIIRKKRFKQSKWYRLHRGQHDAKNGNLIWHRCGTG